ncbi:hypothetical protein EAO74_09225 [Streptomyces sp. gb1(2016)]|uniref:Uncharacterized protein n=1 Tax=Streptomyces sp. gb1(2016) TaxID=1828321 RepID=A0A652L5K4_9ACTN|nr:hypothetical protein EAO74_09225 [Streptomyces sp. gb1(2016)]
MLADRHQRADRSQSRRAAEPQSRRAAEPQGRRAAEPQSRGGAGCGAGRHRCADRSRGPRGCRARGRRADRLPRPSQREPHPGRAPRVRSVATYDFRPSQGRAAPWATTAA